jgi:opacity protein-like surface antigen/outer membrane protein OmpA-like peptidoglycan-associated protein
MRKCFVVVGLLLLTTGLVWAQDFPKVETSPAFMYIHTPIDIMGDKRALNCAGGGGTFAYNFTSALGIAADMGGCKFFGQTFPVLSAKVDGYAFTYLFGPRFTYRNKNAFTPFGEINFGGTRLSLSCKNATGEFCVGNPTYSKNAFAMTVGGGFDIKLSKKFSLRPIQAEYLLTRFGNDCSQGQCFNFGNQNSFRLKSGIVIAWGGAPAVPPAASCSVRPTEVMVGEPVTATVSASNFNPKHTVTYAWTGNGGQVTGKDTTAQIDTTNAAPGSYAVTAHVTDAKAKKNNEASCSANYIIKPLPPKNPPTMSCSASPSSVQAGTSVTVTCNCTSPDGVPVSTSNWTASSGTVSGTGNTATLNTDGVAPGTIRISATCTDSRGLTGQASTLATVENQPPPPPKATKLSQCDFPNEKKPWRVDNTCKALLDDVATSLKQNPDSKLVIVGNADPTEKRKNLAGERAVDSKAYLVGGEAKQGIDASRIEVRTGSGGTKTTEYWIVPAGATFDSTGTQPVDESMVLAIPDHPKPVARKKAAAEKAQ